MNTDSSFTYFLHTGMIHMMKLSSLMTPMLPKDVQTSMIMSSTRVSTMSSIHCSKELILAMSTCVSNVRYGWNYQLSLTVASQLLVGLVSFPGSYTSCCGRRWTSFTSLRHIRFVMSSMPSSTRVTQSSSCWRTAPKLRLDQNLTQYLEGSRLSSITPLVTMQFRLVVIVLYKYIDKLLQQNK